MVSSGCTYNYSNRYVPYKEISEHKEYAKMLKAIENGEMIRVRRGVYASPECLLSNMIDIELIVPRGVLCLYNAWAYHQLTTTIPPAFYIAIEAKRKVVVPDLLPIHLCYWKDAYLELGIETKVISGHRVRITNLERSVCDAIKYRNKVGMDLCVEIVKSYLQRSDRNLSLLSTYAQELRITKILNNILDICL